MKKVTPESIEMAYQIFLGRTPEGSIDLQVAAEQFRDINHLREAILKSPEAAFTLYNSAMSHLAGVWVRRPTRFGRQINVCLSDLGVSKTILLTGDWEAHVGREILSRLTPGSVFLDVGANIGWFTLLAADHLQKIGGGEVIAVEANPKVATYLASSVVASGLEGIVRILPYAVSERLDTVSMSTSQEGNVGGLSIGRMEAGSKTSAIVPSIPLDVLLGNLERLDVIKMDIEGAEPRAIAGFEKTLRRLNPAIIMEINKDGLSWVSESTVAEMVEQMKRLGYGPHGPVGNNARPMSTDEVVRTVNAHNYWDILFLKVS